MKEYTLWTVVAVLGVVALELLVLRTGIFRRAQYWLAMAIVFFFQCLVDGYLTKLSDPIVIYDPQRFLGVRAPFDIPVEDFGFGFAMITLCLLLWIRAGDHPRSRDGYDPRDRHDLRDRHVPRDRPGRSDPR